MGGLSSSSGDFQVLRRLYWRTEIQRIDRFGDEKLRECLLSQNIHLVEYLISGKAVGEVPMHVGLGPGPQRGPKPNRTLPVGFSTRWVVSGHPRNRG